MAFSAKNLLNARRLGVLGLFVGTFSVFFGAFYLKYIPSNEAELNTRGFRILNQLVSNIGARNLTLASAFSNIGQCTACSLGDVDTLMNQLQGKVGFSLDSKTIHEPTLYTPDTPALGRAADQECLMYSVFKGCHAQVPIAHFMTPIVAARSDLFSNYVVLRKDSSHVLQILYLQSPISASYGMSVDSALAMQKNTDLTDVSTIVIEGQPYLLFYQPFVLAGSRLVLGGLILKSDYDKRAKTLPATFVVGMIWFILLGLIVLPFLKVFFLSPGENIRKFDVLGLDLSAFVGAAIFVMGGVYVLASFAARNGVENNLASISGALTKDIRQDLNGAAGQLDAYSKAYMQLSQAGQVELAYKDPSHVHQRSVDTNMLPVVYPLTARVIWFDAKGHTLAKWNPFAFLSPKSDLDNFSFFKVLHRKSPNDFMPVLSAGQSNITGEFQMFMAKKIRYEVDTGILNRPDKVEGFGLLLTFYLHCGLHPVLPRGYGFCLVDNASMDVMMHSDARRNLSENLFRETDNNQRLKTMVNYQQSGLIQAVDLYGTPHTMYVRPIPGEAITLVTFYDDDTHAQNIFRLIHFGAENFLYMFIAFAACLLLSTTVAKRPSKLSFKLDPVEWVRPIKRNWKSYRFNRWYFLSLLGLGIVFFLLLALMGWDIRPAYYISLVLPFYALWGFLSSRRKDAHLCPPDTDAYGMEANAAPPPRHPWYAELVVSALPVVILLFLLNWFIFSLISAHDMNHSPETKFVFLAFQVFALFLLGWLYRSRCCVTQSEASRKDGEMKYAQNYILSLYYSIIIMSVLPVMGCMWYGWSVEKIQYTRTNLLSISDQHGAHLDYVSKDLLPGLKSSVRSGLNALDGNFEKELLDSSGQYLSASTEINPVSPEQAALIKERSVHHIDRPYINLLDEIFLITAGEYNCYSVGTESADSSWFFSWKKPDSVQLIKVARQHDFRTTTVLNGALFSFHGLSWYHGLWVVLLTIIFFAGILRILALTVNRVFLLGYIKDEIAPSQNVLEAFYPQGKFPFRNFIRYEGTQQKKPLDDQEIYTLETMMDNKEKFQSIWSTLSGEERYFLFDFAYDRYANYKDAELLFRMIKRGLLRYDVKKCECNLFTMSFREFVLQKKGSSEITRLKLRYSVPGVWATIRIPVLIVVAACAFLLLMTQENVTHQVTVLVTSVGAIVPVLLEITKKLGKGGS
jgi:hypothetical protein